MCELCVVVPAAAVVLAADKVVVASGGDTVAFIRIFVYDMLQNAAKVVTRTHPRALRARTKPETKVVESILLDLVGFAFKKTL